MRTSWNLLRSSPLLKPTNLAKSAMPSRSKNSRKATKSFSRMNPEINFSSLRKVKPMPLKSSNKAINLLKSNNIAREASLENSLLLKMNLEPLLCLPEPPVNSFHWTVCLSKDCLDPLRIFSREARMPMLSLLTRNKMSIFNIILTLFSLYNI